jgi:hypothetical protein
MGFEEGFDTFAAALPAKAGSLDAAEGRRGIRQQAAVHTDHAGLQPVRDPQ